LILLENLTGYPQQKRTGLPKKHVLPLGNALFERQGQFLLQNLRHPSLRAKKYAEARDIWQLAFSSRSGFFIFNLGRHLLSP
jgi:hypothetical protein